MKLGERVVVDAAVTGDGEHHKGWIADMGDGEHHKGWIADIYEFLRETFVEVKFDSPAADGRPGCIVNNMGMIRESQS